MPEDSSKCELHAARQSSFKRRKAFKYQVLYIPSLQSHLFKTIPLSSPLVVHVRMTEISPARFLLLFRRVALGGGHRYLVFPKWPNRPSNDRNMDIRSPWPSESHLASNRRLEFPGRVQN